MVHLIASDNMNENKHIGGCNEPRRLLEGHQNVVVDFVSKYIVPEKRNREVTYEDHEIGYNDPLPHGHLGGLFGRGRDGRLNLQHHVVASEGERHVPQRIEEVKSILRCVLPPQTVRYVLRCPLC